MVIQIVCNTKEDFPLKGETLLVGNKKLPVISSKVAHRIVRSKKTVMYFVNVLVSA